MDRFIVMDDVSGVADISRRFATFLTVSRKFGYHCVYVFHVIATSQIWQKIISEANIFFIFPSSVPHNSFVKILQSNCIIQSKKYVPIRSLWPNRVFTDLANSGKKHCLIIDCSTENRNGSGQYRTLADNPDQQVCYFNKPQDDIFYNIFISKRIKAENFDQGIYIKIEKVTGKTDKESFDAKKTVEDGTGDDRLSKIFTISNQKRGGGKRHAGSDEYLFRRARKSARPKFLSGR